MLSIIIPTKNEESSLPRLLNCLKNQSFQDFEIIIADANSNDKTRVIAKQFNAKIVRGGLPGVGRNNGAKFAKFNNLLFLDADVCFPVDFLKNNMHEFVSNDYDCAAPYVKPLSDRFDYNLVHFSANVCFKALSYVAPVAAGFHIFVKKDVFNSVGGFDADVPFGEDFHFVHKASKKNKFGILPVPIFVDTRRLEKDGKIKFCVQGAYTYLHTLIFGPVKKNIFNYEFCSK